MRSYIRVTVRCMIDSALVGWPEPAAVVIRRTSLPNSIALACTILVSAETGCFDAHQSRDRLAAGTQGPLWRKKKAPVWEREATGALGRPLCPGG